MNPFNSAIHQAKQRQQRIMFWGVVGFLVVALFVSAILFASRGTRIDVLPEAAQPASLKIERGIGIILFDSIYALGKIELVASAPKYQPTRQIIDSDDFGNVIQITLLPMPSEVRFSTNIQDEKIAWRLDDDDAIYAERLERILSPGDYQLTVDHPYYETKAIHFALESQQLIEKNIDLSPISGVFQVTSIPSQARVFIDDVEQGLTPVSVSLNGGEYAVKVQREGYADTEELITITKTAPSVSRQYQLNAEQGYVDLQLQPTDGRLLINDIQVAPSQRLILTANQTHRLNYSKPGYIAESRSIEVVANQTQRVAFALEPSIGRVEIQSTPAAEVVINGEVKGKTPLSLALSTVPQQVSVKLAGYRSQTQTVTPNRQSAQQVSFSLVPETQAALNEAPREYTTQAGGEMRLFMANEVVTMGARRDETGQRANEFIRQVQITRPFYAGVHEVTFGEYQQFDASRSGQERHPITNISWLDAARFANWLSAKENLPTVYQIQGNQLIGINAQANGYRLLTEAEWEWLARKANRSQQTTFAWGSATTIPKQAANIADESAKASVREYVPRYDDGFAGIAPVKSMGREVSGLYDMAGNVSEWVHDSYSLTPPKNNGQMTDRLDTQTIAMRVFKGANWQSGSLTTLRASFRDGAETPREDVGFRIGRYVTQGAP